MNKRQCPNCRAQISEDQRLSGQCPVCKSFFESQIPQMRPVVHAPDIQTRTSRSRGTNSGRSQSTGTQSNGSGWIWFFLIMLGMGILRAAVSGNWSDSSTDNYRNEYQSTVVEDLEKLQRMQQRLEASRQREQEGPWHEYTVNRPVSEAQVWEDPFARDPFAHDAFSHDHIPVRVTPEPSFNHGNNQYQPRPYQPTVPQPQNFQPQFHQPSAPQPHAPFP